MRLWLALILSANLLVLQGCAPLLVAGSAAGGVAAHDRRSLGSFVDDSAIELRAAGLIDANDGLKQQVHINVTSVNGIVLLTGEATTAELHERVLNDLKTIPGIRSITDDIRIAPPSSVGERTGDTWLTTKVKARLLNTKNLDSSRIKVITENKAIYLLGLVKQQEGDLATEAARTIDGVDRVVKLFEYID